MTKKSCRRTMDENKIHEKAVKMRKKTDEQLVHYVEDRVEKARSKRISGKPLTPYERTRAQVAATGNRWAMENFYATHS